MKKFVFSLLILFCFLSIFAQQTGILKDKNGQPSTIFLKLPDTTYIHHIKDGQIPEHLTFDDKYMISPSTMFDRGSYDNNSIFIDNLDSLEPGVLPEGDLPYKIKYTSDGQRLIVMYHHSNNVYVYDTETNETLGIVNVGLGPEDMVVTEQYIYVCCYYSNEIYIINLDDYSIESSFPVDSHPCVIKVNSDESIIYIGFHLGEHRGGFLAAYDLETNNQIFSSTGPFIDQINMWEGFIGRLVYTYSKFLLVGNDRYIACLKQGSMNLLILDANTGDIVKELDINSFALVSTPSGDTLYTAGVKYGNSGMRYYCINTNTFEILDSIIAPSATSPISWLWQDNLCIDATGTKLFIEMRNMNFGTTAYMADFNSYNQKVFDALIGDPHYFPAVSYDRRYVLLPQDYLAVFDFETEDYVSYHYMGRPVCNCKVVDASPNSYKFAWHSHMGGVRWSKYIRDESIDIYDFTDPANVMHIDTIFCGEGPEADLVYSAVLNTNHDKIISANTLSGNISIFDGTTRELDTLIDIKRINNITNVTDDLLVLSGYKYENLYLFDLNTLSIIKQFQLTNPYDATVIPSPDQQYFYTYNRHDYQLIKYHIDGSNSQIIDSLYIEDSFVHFLDWDSRYFPEISPDGQYIMFQYFGDFRIVHTGRMELECTVPTTLYIFDMAFTDDSKRVCIAHGIWVGYFSIVYLDGPNSYLEHTVHTGSTGGMAVEYNPVDQKFYLAMSSDIFVVGPKTGLIEDTLHLNAKNYLMQIGIDPYGNPVAQTINYLYYNDQEYFLRDPARLFSMNNESYKCIIPRPGPDNVFVLDFLTTEIYEMPTSKIDDGISIYPNPTHDKITVKSGKIINRIEIFSSGGDKLFDKNFRNTMTTLSLVAYPDGVYFVKIHRGKDSVSKNILLVH